MQNIKQLYYMENITGRRRYKTKTGIELPYNGLALWIESEKKVEINEGEPVRLESLIC